MSLETEQSEFRRRSREAEASREAKEGEADPEMQAGAAMERADVIIKEVKTNKKQMQNIVLHMQEVSQAIQQLRAQLQLAQTDDDVTSLKQDKKRVEELKKKIQDYGVELEKMREDLISEEIEELKNGIGVGLSAGELRKRAEEMVGKMIAEIKQ